MATTLDEDLRALLECGVATVIGTHDAALAPEIARGWGVHVVDAKTVEVCVGLPSAQRTLTNLAENGQIAMTCVRPSDYRQVQLKGRVVETLEPTDEDRARVGRHREAFRDEVAHVGISAHLVDGFWNHDPADSLVKIRFAVGDAYEQTPGPDAGRPL